MRIKRITIAVPRRLFDCVLLWVSVVVISGVVFIGGVCGVGVVISGVRLRGVGVGVTILLGVGVDLILEGDNGITLVTVLLEDGGSVPTVHPVPVVSQ